eukprot:Blabericola_migrator_1__6362@NODE_3209_length_1948_cov_8_602871_g2009_i0_p2_GENE_NODE_3209_length_1948_cov_8_602871_g2009_i0NODE_3209_length_1948_cov_8_602871_g2009_i0_p2_ORF_typecomplete_len150_score24_50_NODE_3209_length_1948_cov_8_602871_g2009_i010861535
MTHLMKLPYIGALLAGLISPVFGSAVVGSFRVSQKLNAKAAAGYNVHTTLALKLMQHFKQIPVAEDILGPPVCMTLAVGGGQKAQRNRSSVSLALEQCVPRMQEMAAKVAEELKPLMTLSAALETRKQDLLSRVGNFDSDPAKAVKMGR